MKKLLFILNLLISTSAFGQIVLWVPNDTLYYSTEVQGTPVYYNYDAGITIHHNPSTSGPVVYMGRLYTEVELGKMFTDTPVRVDDLPYGDIKKLYSDCLFNQSSEDGLNVFVCWSNRYIVTVYGNQLRVGDSFKKINQAEFYYPREDTTPSGDERISYILCESEGRLSISHKNGKITRIFVSI